MVSPTLFPGSERGPGPGVDPVVLREAGAGASAGGFWQQMGSPRLEREREREREPSHARVSKRGGNSQSRL